MDFDARERIDSGLIREEVGDEGLSEKSAPDGQAPVWEYYRNREA
jgi:hypothetical protein